VTSRLGLGARGLGLCFCPVYQCRLVWLVAGPLCHDAVFTPAVETARSNAHGVNPLLKESIRMVGQGLIGFIVTNKVNVDELKTAHRYDPTPCPCLFAPGDFCDHVPMLDLPCLVHLEALSPSNKGRRKTRLHKLHGTVTRTLYYLLASIGSGHGKGDLHVSCHCTTTSHRQTHILTTTRGTP
jgi:hypothetical protein